jgi:gluconate kinase
MEPRAQMFLAKTRVDLSKQTATLDKLDLSRVSAGEPLSDNDLDKYLARKNDMNITACIQDSISMTQNSLRRHYTNRLEVTVYQHFDNSV